MSDKPKAKARKPKAEPVAEEPVAAVEAQPVPEPAQPADWRARWPVLYDAKGEATIDADLETSLEAYLMALRRFKASGPVPPWFDPKDAGLEGGE